ncbi:GNAT family N-acetyltransferase [Maritalea mediterranea]|uniref:GNAT family N-acetyltransferase n=1 Tax=Maritalea mediterranea TaxID=2909667 RepID=A0ABS9E413_9HYPH|nr:GNAT family N-acetyltransferase [Maritalea mediterranea]MCF4096937.1 GNAT family N-acetyltransferase [Maritalea mediterranea]
MAEIRRLTPKDAEIFREIRIEGFRNHPAAFGSGLQDVEDQPLSYFESWLDNLNAYGAFDDGALVAVAAYALGKGANVRHTANLIAVYARPQARGKGIMAQMIEAMCDDARQAGIEQVTLCVTVDNQAAQKTYRKLGFERFGTAPKAILYDGHYYDEDLMVRFL